ncbi:hypothetical protein VIGAN_04227500 [Vigna angularis var. angularis]|uniref:Uncharacterized protein n=1 Tax=Vigna angularis var. angularis TaxID=157739 RepID=A0A0S3RW35_PHAAN|nr:hypothetical protein VIGAN_04227500 [Vigna angularis var. angularis]
MAMKSLQRCRANSGSTCCIKKITDAVDESGFEKIVNAKSSREAWQILEKVYKGDNHVKQVRLQTLKDEFESLRLESR